MKVAFVSTVQGHKWPGSEYLWSTCAAKLLAAKHDVFVAVSEDLRGAKPLEQLQADGVELKFISPGFGRLARLSQRLIPAYGSIEKYKPDLLVVSSGSAFDPVYLMALGKFLVATKIPFIFICHFNAETFWVDEAMRDLMVKIYSKAVKTVFVSQENLRLTERQLALTIPRPAVIVPPLCTNIAEPLAWPASSADGPWKLACVARLEPRWKGQDVLCEVLAGEIWRGRNYQLNLFGEGAEADYLQRLVKFYRLTDKVRFAGFAPPEKIWKEHHLQILAARGEGGPMVITEGMMCGRIAVTTRCGFIPEYVVDGETGFLADFATSACFGAAMERAWSHRMNWQEMGQRAHHAIKTRSDDFLAPERLLALILERSIRTS